MSSLFIPTPLHIKRLFLRRDRGSRFVPTIDVQKGHYELRVPEIRVTADPFEEAGQYCLRLSDLPEDVNRATADSCAEAIARIPTDIRSAVSEFPAGNWCSEEPGQWEMLTFLSCVDGAMDLYRVNRTLAFCLAGARHFVPPELVGTSSRVVRQSQRDILQFLAFPGSKSCAKLMRRIAPRDLSRARLVLLRRAFDKDVDLSILQHLTCVTGEILDLVLDPRTRSHLSPRFLAAVAECEDPNLAKRVFRWATESIRLGQSVEKVFPGLDTFFDWETEVQTLARTTRPEARPRPAQVPPPVRRAGIKARRESRTGVDGFPIPPLEGSEYIKPLVSAAAVAKWADHQSNCASSKISRVREGDYYLYKVLGPEEEATLAVVLHIGEWQISELKAARNRSPGRITDMICRQWLGKENSRRADRQARQRARVNGR